MGGSEDDVINTANTAVYFQLEYSDDIHEILLNTWYKQGLQRPCS